MHLYFSLDHLKSWHFSAPVFYWYIAKKGVIEKNLGNLGNNLLFVDKTVQKFKVVLPTSWFKQRLLLQSGKWSQIQKIQNTVLWTTFSELDIWTGTITVVLNYSSFLKQWIGGFDFEQYERRAKSVKTNWTKMNGRFDDQVQ